MADFSERRVLGRTGLIVSRLGLASGYGISAVGVEKAYHEFGLNYFYWSTPRRKKFGEGLRNLIGSNRDDIVIAIQSYDHLGWTVERSIHKSLKSLGVDQVDVIILGWHNRQPRRSIIEGALKAKEQGLVRFIAMSGHNRKLFGQLAQQPESPIDIFMIRYNAAHRGAEDDIFPHLPEENRPGVTIYTSTCWGKLLKQNKMPPGERPLTAAECYRFVLSNPKVDLCMIGPKNEQQMLDGAAALRQGPLSETEMQRLVKIGDHLHR